MSAWLLRVHDLPLYLYRHGWGWVLGHRVLQLTHRGRRSGRLRWTVLQVLRYDPKTGEAVVMSGSGPTTHWLRNIQANDQLEVKHRALVLRRQLPPSGARRGHWGPRRLRAGQHPGAPAGARGPGPSWAEAFRRFLRCTAQAGLSAAHGGVPADGPQAGGARFRPGWSPSLPAAMTALSALPAQCRGHGGPGSDRVNRGPAHLLRAWLAAPREPVPTLPGSPRRSPSPDAPSPARAVRPGMPCQPSGPNVPQAAGSTDRRPACQSRGGESGRLTATAPPVIRHAAAAAAAPMPRARSDPPSFAKGAAQ
jgi:deazaflavin-dependent oxidoreductase (nitroreductase family)